MKSCRVYWRDRQNIEHGVYVEAENRYHAFGLAMHAMRVGGAERWATFWPALFANVSPRLSLLPHPPRTVLAVKGPLRRAQQRRALDGSGPF